MDFVICFCRYKLPQLCIGYQTHSIVNHNNILNKLGGAHLLLFSVLLRCIKKTGLLRPAFKEKDYDKKGQYYGIILCFITPTAEK